MIAAAATFHVQNVAFGENESYASLESIGVMASAQAESGGSYTCSSGGPGSLSCSTSVSGGGGSISGGTSCSVTCSSGYYACCNAWHNKCQCRAS